MNIACVYNRVSESGGEKEGGKGEEKGGGREGAGRRREGRGGRWRDHWGFRN